MDASPHNNWEELIKLAADRTGWRQLVQALKGGRPPPPRLTIKISANVPGAKVKRPNRNPVTKKNKTKMTAKMQQAKRQRIRDAHHALFHPKSKKAKLFHTKTKEQKKKKKSALQN